MKQFEVGHSYGAVDWMISPIEVIRRTARFITVRNEYGMEWRMKIRECEGLNDSRYEIAIDSSAGRNWKDAFTYAATLEK